MQRTLTAFLLLCLLFLWPAHLPKDRHTAPEAPEEALLNAFAADVLLHHQFGRNTFYTWTTTEQIDTLRKNAPFLLKSVSDEGELSLYDMALTDKKYSKDPIGQLLRNPAFARKRYAWSNPWATCSAMSPEYYGDQLIEIVLEDSAYICAFFPDDKEPFRVMRADGKPVSKQQVIQNPNRIAAVYHVNVMNKRRIGQVKREGTRNLPGKRFTRYYEPFREYIIVNERMIKQWSYGTPGVVDHIAKDLYKFTRLSEKEKFTEMAKGYCGKNFVTQWNKPAAAESAETRVMQGAVFTTGNIDPELCTAIAATLKETFFAQKTKLLKYPSKRYH